MTAVDISLDTLPILCHLHIEYHLVINYQDFLSKFGIFKARNLQFEIISLYIFWYLRLWLSLTGWMDGDGCGIIAKIYRTQLFFLRFCCLLVPRGTSRSSLIHGDLKSVICLKFFFIIVERNFAQFILKRHNYITVVFSAYIFIAQNILI